MEIAKLFTRTILISSLLFMMNASAQAGVQSASEKLIITAVNGQSPELNNPVSLRQGKNLVELKYDGIFPSYTDDTEARITSGRLYLPLDIVDNRNYQIQLDQINTEEDANQFILAPYIYLINDRGERIKRDLLNQNKLITQLFLAM